MMWMRKKLTDMPSPEDALPGRPDPLPVENRHFVNGHPIKPPFPEGVQFGIPKRDDLELEYLEKVL